jgi:calcium-independent phospholipase A2
MSSPYFVPTIQSQLSNLNKLKKLNHALSPSPPPLQVPEKPPSDDPPDRNRPPKPPRRKRSPTPPPPQDFLKEYDIIEEKRPSRPSSFNGEDSLTMYNLRLYGDPNGPSNGGLLDVPHQVKRVESPIIGREGSDEISRKRVYSKGSKEEKQMKKKSPDPVFPHGMGMSPDQPPVSMLKLIDLEENMSLMRGYERDIKLDIKDVTHHQFPSDTPTSPHINISKLSFDEELHEPPEVDDMLNVAPPNRTHKLSVDEGKFSGYGNLPRSESMLSNFSTASTGSKKKSKNILKKIVHSPLFSRKNNEAADIQSVSDFSTANPTVSPLFSASPRSLVKILKDPSLDPNVRDDYDNTALHWYVLKPRRQRHTLALKCLQSGRDFDVNACDAVDNSPLHIAAEKNDLQYARILIAFGADMFLVNYQGFYPRDLAQPNSPLHQLLSSFPTPLDNEIIPLSYLPSELNSLNLDELHNEKIGHLIKTGRTPALVRIMDGEIKKIERMSIVDYSMPAGGELLSLSNRSEDQRSLDSAITDQRFYLRRWKGTAGSRILFLDGGGVRGLIEVEVLMEIERRTGRRIVELFDWIVGTSTGGIIAAALVYGNKSLLDIKQLIFKLKNEVFDGSGLAGSFLNMAQKTKNMESLLHRELGDITMNSVKEPRVMICAVNKERIPMSLVFFNNFMKNRPELTDIKVWEAIRATSAAPIYFTPYKGKYVDGGVMANNPCEESVSEIARYDQEMGLPERHYLLAVSVGTGIYPDKSLEGADWNKGYHIKKKVMYMKELVDMLKDTVSHSYSIEE